MSSALASFAYLFFFISFLFLSLSLTYDLRRKQKRKKKWNDFSIYFPPLFFCVLVSPPHFLPSLLVSFRCFFLSWYRWILFHFHVLPFPSFSPSSTCYFPFSFLSSSIFFVLFLFFSFFFSNFYCSSDCVGRCGSHGPLFQPPPLHPPSLILIPIFTSSNNSREINWEKRRAEKRRKERESSDIFPGLGKIHI